MTTLDDDATVYDFSIDTDGDSTDSDEKVYEATAEEKPYQQDDTPERKPERKERRQDGSTVLSFAWSGIGMWLVRSGTDVGVGRVMQLQGPYAGNKLDSLFADTIIDRFIVQPLARGTEKVEGLGALFAAPLLVGVYERNPSLGPTLYPVMREVFEQMLSDLVPMLKKQAADKRKTAKALNDLSDVFDIPPGTDPVDYVLQMVFSPGPEATPGEEGGEE